MGQVNADCDACMCQDFMLYGAISLPGGAPAPGATVYLLAKAPKMLTQTDGRGRFQVPGLCPDGKTILKITKTKFSPIVLTMPKTGLKSATINAEFVRAGDRGPCGRRGCKVESSFPGSHSVKPKIFTMTHRPCIPWLSLNFFFLFKFSLCRINVLKPQWLLCLLLKYRTIPASGLLHLLCDSVQSVRLDFDFGMSGTPRHEDVSDHLV